jgi:hypothetical protein
MFLSRVTHRFVDPRDVGGVDEKDDAVCQQTVLFPEVSRRLVW